jgi:hypothetical protein
MILKCVNYLRLVRIRGVDSDSPDTSLNLRKISDLGIALLFTFFITIFDFTFLKHFEYYYRFKGGIKKHTLLERYAKISIFLKIGIQVTFQINTFQQRFYV